MSATPGDQAARLLSAESWTAAGRAALAASERAKKSGRLELAFLLLVKANNFFKMARST